MIVLIALVVDLAASVNPHFQYVSMPDDPMLSTAVDCRMVHDTVGEGYVSSQDFSFDCESMFFTLVRLCLLPAAHPF